MVTKEKTLEDEIRLFLENFDFATLEWDGNEIILYSTNGEPWNIREFNHDSKTQRALRQLENKIARAQKSPFTTSLKT